jgi:hypothetical protein
MHDRSSPMHDRSIPGWVRSRLIWQQPQRRAKAILAAEPRQTRGAAAADLARRRSDARFICRNVAWLALHSQAWDEVAHIACCVFSRSPR